MTEPITSEAQITPAWLTATLKLNRLLLRGEVVRIKFTTSKTFFCHIHWLDVVYSPDSTPQLPTKLLLKIPFSDNDAALNMGRDEVAAYQTLLEAMDDPPVARCFDAVYSPATRASHLLLEDLSDTHFQPELPLPPSQRHCELCVETLARFHAFWWEHPDLGKGVGQLFDEAAQAKLLELLLPALTRFVEFLGDRLSPTRRKALEQSISTLPQFWKSRLMSAQRNTLIHGDAHLWNFMHPKDTEHGRAYLIDLATSNRVRPPTNDLAYMMALQWFPDRRVQMEEPLLRHYHKRLTVDGVRNYSWQDCLLDYRYSVVTHLFTPVMQWDSKQVPAFVWWNNFERISEAYRDLRCEELE